MTVVFGFATNEFVFLAADGRRSNAYETQTDEAEKIEPVNDTFAVAVLGAVIGSDVTLDFARKHIAPFDNGEVIQRRLEEGVFIGAKHVMSLIRPEDLSLTRIKVGMVGGGIDSKGPYLVGSLFGTMMDGPSTVLCRVIGVEPRYIVLGGESSKAEDYFVNELVGKLKVQPKSIEDLLAKLLQAVEATVRYTAILDNTVGGRIQYRLQLINGQLHSGFVA